MYKPVLINEKEDNYMSRRFSALLLCAAMFFSTFASISASEESIGTQVATTPITQSARSNTSIDLKAFKTMNPGVTDYKVVSVSASEHSYTAKRLSNGNIQILINQGLLTTRCYYQHLATDANGDYFTPEKDVYFYIQNKGDTVYSVELSKDAVSNDGYVFLQFAIQPPNLDQKFEITNYKIPVDYEANKLNAEEFYTATPDELLINSFSASYAKYYASAYKQADGTADLYIHSVGTNANLWFENIDTDGNIIMPHKNDWYHLRDLSEPEDLDRWYHMVIPQDKITNGYIYINAYFLLPAPMNYYSVGTFKVHVQE